MFRRTRDHVTVATYEDRLDVAGAGNPALTQDQVKALRESVVGGRDFNQEDFCQLFQCSTNQYHNWIKRIQQRWEKDVPHTFEKDTAPFHDDKKVVFQQGACGGPLCAVPTKTVPWEEWHEPAIEQLISNDLQQKENGLYILIQQAKRNFPPFWIQSLLEKSVKMTINDMLNSKKRRCFRTYNVGVDLVFKGTVKVVPAAKTKAVPLNKACLTVNDVTGKELGVLWMSEVVGSKGSIPKATIAKVRKAMKDSEDIEDLPSEFELGWTSRKKIETDSVLREGLTKYQEVNPDWADLAMVVIGT